MFIAGQLHRQGYEQSVPTHRRYAEEPGNGHNHPKRGGLAEEYQRQRGGDKDDPQDYQRRLAGSLENDIADNTQSYPGEGTPQLGYSSIHWRERYPARPGRGGKVPGR